MAHVLSRSTRAGSRAKWPGARPQTVPTAGLPGHCPSPLKLPLHLTDTRISAAKTRGLENVLFSHKGLSSGLRHHWGSPSDTAASVPTGCGDASLKGQRRGPALPSTGWRVHGSLARACPMHGALAGEWGHSGFTLGDEGPSWTSCVYGREDEQLRRQRCTEVSALDTVPILPTSDPSSDPCSDPSSDPAPVPTQLSLGLHCPPQPGPACSRTFRVGHYLAPHGLPV